jgi:hypothetical protein
MCFMNRGGGFVLWHMCVLYISHESFSKRSIASLLLCCTKMRNICILSKSEEVLRFLHGFECAGCKGIFARLKEESTGSVPGQQLMSSSCKY